LPSSDAPTTAAEAVAEVKIDTVRPH